MSDSRVMVVRPSAEVSTPALRDRVVQGLLEAAHALTLAVTARQFKLVADAAHAQEVFAARQQLGKDLELQAHAIHINALSALGDTLKALPKAKGATSGGKKSGPRGSFVELRDQTPTLADLGIDKKTSAFAQQLAALPEPIRHAIASRETTLAKVRRAQKAQATRRRVQLPNAKYRVVYADPPWSYNDKCDDGAVQAGGAERHYPSMSIAELCDLPVRDLCEPDAVLFLWVTSPLLFEAAPVMNAWGFTYRTSMVWHKDRHNMGHYVSVRHEFLLIGVRGSCLPDVKRQYPSVLTEKPTAHSAKPETFRAVLDAMYPYGKRLELFARRRVSGWDSWGYEAPGEPLAGVTPKGGRPPRIQVFGRANLKGCP